MIRVALLGRFAATDDSDRPLDLPTRKSRALLAYLAMPAGRLHARDVLATLLWGDAPTDRARNSLRQCLFGIRQALGPAAADVLVHEGDGLGLAATAVQTDLADLERLAARPDPESLEAAAACCRGELLEGFGLDESGFDEWLAVERERVRELVLGTLNRLLTLQAGAGAGQEAIGTALRLLSLDPLQEPVHRTLMRLYGQRGRRNEALRQYRRCADLLARELGVDPEPETERLRDELLVVDEEVRPRPVRGGAAPVILVVEDDPASRAMLEGLLVVAGYRVSTVSDGAEALRVLGQEHVDLVLSDIRMPRLDGFTLLQRMRQRRLRIPTILVTSGTEDELEVKGLSLGARDYIRKPIGRDVLLLRVENALGRRAGP